MKRTRLSKTRLIAEVVSLLTNPIIVLIVSLVIIVNHFAGSSRQSWNWSLAGAFLLVGPAVLYASIDWYKDRRIDLDLSKRRERLVPMLLATMGALVGSFLANKEVANHSLQLVSYDLVAMLLFLTIVTFVWKISLHTSTMSAIVMLLVILRGPWFALGILLVIPIGWARMYLKQHTLAQVTAGSLVGVLTTYSAWLVFR
ncbi:MAG TPA: phosphatase PAP2 family protein [Candidatus Saccharimonadales bacterium]|nr:phosphatase PAP2 family protein [Candidatus Saccharimonadales bacterium]